MVSAARASSPVEDRLMLRLVLPKGSLERQTLQLFDDADLAVSRGSDVDYRGVDRRPADRRGAHPAAAGDPAATSPRAASTSASPGATGSRSATSTSSRSRSCTTRRRPRGRSASCSRSRPTDPAQTVTDLPPGRRGAHRVPRAHPSLLRPSTASTPTCTLSYGATEAKVPDIADAVVEITETGRALRAAGLRILDTMLVSYTELHREPGRVPRTPRSARRWSRSRCCSPARSRRAAGCC